VRPQVKYLAIYHHKGKYPITTICQFFGISRSGYYEYVKRIDKPQFDQSLAILIAECQQTCRRTYGYRRVHIWLQKRGIYRNPKTVLRIMQKYDLLAQIRRYRKYRQMGEQLHKYPNLLDRQFTALRQTKSGSRIFLTSIQVRESCTCPLSGIYLTTALFPTKPVQSRR